MVEGKRGRYEIERVLVSGAMGRLHLARDQDGRPVIVKVPRVMNDALDQVREERLRLEGGILHDLWDEKKADTNDRAHVLRYVDEGVYDSRYFFVSEFVEGGRLKELVGGKPASLTSTSAYMKDILRALSYLHQREVIHRDINPKNLLVRTTGELVLIDFGLAHRPGQHPVPGGTRPYAGPEQFEDPPRIRESSDVYGAGATLLFLLIGREPDWLDSDRSDRTAFRNHTATLPSKLADVIETSIQHNARNRFQSVSEMSDAMDSALSGIRTGYLIIRGREFEIFGRTEIGRKHHCDSECFRRSLNSPLTLAIDDPDCFVSAHHVRIWFEDDVALLQDLESKNGTAIRPSGGSDFIFLGSRASAQKEPYQLKGGEQIALAYDKTAGAHITMSFRKVPSRSG